MSLIRRLWPFGRGHPGHEVIDHERVERTLDREVRRQRTERVTGELHAASVEARRVVASNRTLRERLTGWEQETTP